MSGEDSDATTVGVKPLTARNPQRTAAARLKVTARVRAAKFDRVAASADGRFVVAVSANDQLLRYRVTPKKITRVGRSAVIKKLRHLYEGDLSLAVHPDGRFAYVAVQPWRKEQKYALLVFRIDRPKPKVVKTVNLRKLYPDKRVDVRGMAMRPDGKRVYLNVRGDLLTFAMGAGKAATLVSAQRGTRLDWVQPTITPDGTGLVTGINGSRSTRFVRYQVWDIAGSTPQPGPVQQLDVSSYDFDEVASLRTVVPAADNTTAYAQIDSWQEDYPDILTARFRLADGVIIADLGTPYGAYKFEDLIGRSPSGHRVYGVNRRHAGGDGGPGFLARATGSLASYEVASPGKFALHRAFAVPSAGDAKGLIYTQQRKNGRLHLVSLKNRK